MAGIFFHGKASRTFRPRKEVKEFYVKTEDFIRKASATLGSGNLKQAVRLPEGQDVYEWVAVHTIDFFNQIDMLYGTVTEACTQDGCPVMSAGPKYEYHWADGKDIKKPVKCSAPKYIDYLMTWASDIIDDETIFPNQIGTPFPKNFLATAKTIYKRFFRVYAHIYHSHFETIISAGEEAHLNSSFKHFMYFVLEFDLIDKKELAPLQELIDKYYYTGNSRESMPKGGANAF